MTDRLEEREENVRPEEEIPQLRTAETEVEAEQAEEVAEHAPGRFDVPSGYRVVTGSSDGDGVAVGVVVAKFNGEITRRLLERALEELEAANVPRESVTIVPVPGAFELPLAAMALAKTRKYACVVALGCVVRGETPHFDFVAGEAARGLAQASAEFDVPVSLGLLTTDTYEQAEARAGGSHGNKGWDSAMAAMEMADLFEMLDAGELADDEAEG
ncbi:MAG TPA: 6,7-dimethyl-8-ribityllumazine synthase [Gaiellaceae bacterium]|nr:6,7-dimethyl-8-ribityllumazine synthase [Gaiellaceae bacterium]